LFHGYNILKCTLEGIMATGTVATGMPTEGVLEFRPSVSTQSRDEGRRDKRKLNLE
jgi:hypothetical protein